MMRRIGVFVFYDADGIVDRYIPYMLTDLMKNLERLVIVVNGKITDEGKATLEQFSSDFVIRENKGFDTWAYKEGMDYVGWDELSQYDEVVIFNDTVMGPVYPFAEMFDEMSKRDVDFWGITRHFQDEINPFHCEYGYTPAHIQSYFEVFRQNFVKSSDFRNYWDNLFPINSYEDAVGKHEIVFTKKFEDLGYKWDTYINAPELEGRHSQPLMAYASLIIRNYRCPIFKKRLFFNDYDWTINTNIGQEPRQILDIIREETDYPAEYVVETLLRARNLRELYMNFHWDYIVPIRKYQDECNLKYGLFVIVRDSMLLGLISQYIKRLPKQVNLYLLVEESILTEVKTLISVNQIDVVDMKSFSKVAMKKSIIKSFYATIPEYDYVGCYMDRDIVSSVHKTMDEAICYKELESVVGTGEYIENLLSVFEKESKLGLLATPTLNHGVYVEYAKFGWSNTYRDVEDVLKQIGKSVSVSETESPLLVQDLCFWASTRALQKIQDDIEKTVSYFLEDRKYEEKYICEILVRLIPFLLQSHGYYTGFVTNTELASIEMDNREYQLSTMIDQRNKWHGMYVEKEQEVELLLKSNQDLIDKVREMENSHSWKITKPLRRLKHLKVK